MLYQFNFFLICLCREFLSLFNHVIFVIKKYIFPMQIFVWSCMRQNISKNPLFHFKFALSNQKTENTIRLDFLCWLRIYNSFWIYSNGSKDTGKILFFFQNPQMCYKQTNQNSKNRFFLKIIIFKKQKHQSIAFLTRIKNIYFILIESKKRRSYD